MNGFLTPADILASREHHDPSTDLIDIRPQPREVRAHGSTTRYYSVLFLKADGTRVPLRLRFFGQLLGSKMKPSGGNAEETPKEMQLSFFKMSEGDLVDSDWAEDQRTELLESNADFVKALSIINDEFRHCVLGNMQHMKGVRGDTKVWPIVQTHRKATKDDQTEDETVPLENPIARLKVPVDRATGLIQRKTREGFKEIVFDARKMTSGRSSDLKPVFIRNGKSIQRLTAKIAHHFVTYLSITAGWVNFDSICVSKFGVSLKNSVGQLLVVPHRKMESDALDQDEFTQLHELANCSQWRSVDISEEDLAVQRGSVGVMNDPPEVERLSEEDLNDLDI